MPEKVWRKLPGLAVETLSSDRQLIVFNALSGDTHLLNRPVDWILAQLEARPRSLNELIGLAIEADIVSGLEVSRESLMNLLENLEKIDLLESGTFA